MSADLGPLAAIVDAAPDAALMCDYDGTLAPIVVDPYGARPLPGVDTVLERLSQHLAVVAVVSGRPVEFLAEHLAGAGDAVALVGLYGAQRRVDGAVITDPSLARWLPVVAQARDRALRTAPPGAVIEDKSVSVTLHWRGVPETEDWARTFAQRESKRSGLMARQGRMALELVSPIAPTKATVAAAFAEGRGAAAYFGDDRADVVAFEALGELAAAGLRVVRVAVSDPESPPELAAMAEMTVTGPEDAVRLLASLADVLSAD